MKKEKNILSKYYNGILTQIQAEVDSINSNFNHQGIKGTGNELVLIEMLKKFIPKKYGIGTGIVIDHQGNQSKQCDIIIYDNHHFPDILSISNSKFYPIELVYAVIEVKTKLTSSKAKEAIENINSVWNLNQIMDRFRIYSTTPVEKIQNDTVFFETISPTRPLGLIFGYKSGTNKINTFHNWFLQKEKSIKYPDRVCCLDQGILALTSKKLTDKPMAFPLNDGEIFQEVEDGEIVHINGEKLCQFQGKTFPFTKIGDANIIIDSASTFLNFIHTLIELLKHKKLNPNLDILDTYMGISEKVIMLEQKGKLVIWNRNKTTTKNG